MAYRFVRSLRTVRFVFTRRGSKVRNLQRPLRRAGSLRGNSGVRPFVFPGTAAVVGIRLVQGYVWRLHVGVDAGWIRTSFARRDLIDGSVPGNEHSFGLGLRDRVSDTLVVAPVAGVEWQLADHWSISVMPRLELLVGVPTNLAAVLPVTVGRSWFLF
jgi:hypothetical protein